MAAISTSVFPPVDGNSIRLLHLEPGEHDDPIRFSLVSVSLDSVPVYEAISYCWGDSNSRQDVSCGGNSMSITTSLWGALRELRPNVGQRILWADGICINQDDEKEKTFQVRLMQAIYAKAKTVVVWLGPMDEAGLLSKIRTSIRRVKDYLADSESESAPEAGQSSITKIAKPDRSERRPSIENDDWKATSELIRRPWFTRKWVVQEIAMAQEVRLYIGGGVQLPWLDLTTLADNVYSMNTYPILLGRLPPEEHGTFSVGVYHIFVMQNVAKSRSLGRGTLVDAVMETRGFLCSDHRDHIYGLLSCASQGPLLDPDYALGAEDTFKKFTQVMLREAQDLKVLSLEPHKGDRWNPCIPRNRTDLPSWVPDLRRPADPMASSSIYDQIFFAGGSQNPVLSLSADGSLLHCQGMIVDEIEDFVPSLYEMLEDEFPDLFETSAGSNGPVDPDWERRTHRYQHWLRACYNLVYGQASFTDITSRKQAFSCTLLRDQGSNAGGRASAELINATFEFVDQMLFQGDTVSAWQRFETIEDENHRLQKLLITVENAISRGSPTRNFSVTIGGRLGQMPIGTERGDLVCVLIGGEVPFVIRPTEPGSTKYHLIGDCFLNGAMNGEMLVSNEHAMREIVLA